MLLIIAANAALAAALITFQSGSTAIATDVNANFTALNADTGANKTAIQNISLTPGAQGPLGATGAQGPQGQTGSQGATGVAGMQGEAGSAGATGPKGTSADTTTVATNTTNTTNISALQTRVTANENTLNIIADFVGFKASTDPEMLESNCSNGDDLQQVIDDASSGAVTITVTGFCAGDFLVRRDGIFLLGNGQANTTLDGSLTFSGSTNSKVQELTITSTNKPALTNP